jgi:hypothetical protein
MNFMPCRKVLKNTLMKKNLSLLMLATGFVAISALFSACGKDDDDNGNTTPITQKEIKLYNQSSGTAIEAGSATFVKLPDGNASATINLAAGYRVNGATMTATITNTIAGNEYIYATLNTVNGTTGTSSTPTVMGATSAIKYDTLVTRTGFVVKVLNGSNVQARGVIQ